MLLVECVYVGMDIFNYVEMPVFDVCAFLYVFPNIFVIISIHNPMYYVAQ